MSSNCDGSKEPIGHGTETLVVYSEDAVDMETPSWDENRAVFGSKECRENFEDYHDIEEDDIKEES